MINNILKHTIEDNILLLQGPVGCFFEKFQDYLYKNGAKKIIKINFNAGDDFFYKTRPPAGKKGKTYHYKEKQTYLSDFYKKIFAEHNIKAVYLFGDCRPIHKLAIRLCKKYNITSYVFEEGYIRPFNVTLEANGVNNLSGVSRHLKTILNKKQNITLPSKNNHGYGCFKHMAFFASLYFLIIYFRQKKYPYYQHHKTHGFLDMLSWVRSYIRKSFYSLRDKIRQRLFFKKNVPFFFVPLQTFNDAQIHEHSHYKDVKDFIFEVITSFAKHAPKDTYLIIKHHPFDRGHRHYGDFIKKLTAHHLLQKRVVYFHEINLPKFLKRAIGVIVINSTVGLSSLFHKTPVKIMGKAFYDIRGLTYQAKLSEFWTNPSEVSNENYTIYRDYLLEHTQISGSFYDRNFFEREEISDTDTPKLTQ